MSVSHPPGTIGVVGARWWTMTAKSVRTTRGPGTRRRCSDRRTGGRGERAPGDDGPRRGDPRDGAHGGDGAGGRGAGASDGDDGDGAGVGDGPDGGRGGSFPTFHTPVRGYRFAARPPGAHHPRPGQPAGLRREDVHPVDPWAVGVWVHAEDGAPWRIGYLERAVAARLGPRLDGGLGVSVTVAGWAPEPGGRWRRPIVRVEPDGHRDHGTRRRARPSRPRTDQPR